MTHHFTPSKADETDSDTRSLCPVSCLVLCLFVCFLFLPIVHLPPFPNPFHLLLCSALPPTLRMSHCLPDERRAERVNYDKHPLWILSAFVLIKEEKDMNASVVTVITSTLGGGEKKKTNVQNKTMNKKKK